MSLKRGLLFVILCNLVRLGWTAEGKATVDMPTVMEAIVHAMIDFRKEILNNLQLSLEYHTEQLDEIKQHTEYKLIELRDEMNRKLEQQRSSSSAQTQELLEGHKEEIKLYVGHKMEEQVKRTTTESEPKFKEVREEIQALLNKSSLQGQEIGKALDIINLRALYGSGWTLFQRRMDGSVDFYQNWTMYKHGFGDINGEHWLGLEKLHVMTKSGRYELLVLLEDFEGNSTFALYDAFKIGSEEEKYKLTVGKFSGTANDKLTYHNGMKFSTKDQDNDLSGDKKDCAIYFQGAWWFKNCYWSHLNGPYHQKGNHLDKSGVDWIDFPRANYSLKSTTMMFRPRT